MIKCKKCNKELYLKKDVVEYKNKKYCISCFRILIEKTIYVKLIK
jgi:hypothetical protein